MPKIDLDGLEVAYEVHGDGPPILMIPGMGLDSSVWSEVARLIEGRFTCIAMTNRGIHRDASPFGPYTISQMANDAAGLLGALGIDRAAVVGHSMGGFVAIRLALDHPPLVGALILLGTAAVGRLDDLGADDGARAALSRTIGPALAIARDIMTACVSTRFATTRRERLERLIAEQAKRPPFGRGLAWQRAACEEFDERSRLSRISCPTAILHGGADRVVAFARGLELQRGIPGASLVPLDEVGHLPQIEAPVEVASAIASFLRDGSPGDPA